MARGRTKSTELGARGDVTVADKRSKRLSVNITSFGYKAGPPPVANVVFDVRFLKNPFWVPELRPLTGMDEPVKQYVLEQRAAKEFLDSFIELLSKLLPRFVEQENYEFAIALGCTGGQHRSTALVEALAERLRLIFPGYDIKHQHRELGEVRS